MAGLDTSVARLLGTRYPIVQAPMAGGFTTPELVAAVSNAGALGSLGAAILPPDELRDAIVLVDQRDDVRLYLAYPRATIDLLSLELVALPILFIAGPVFADTVSAPASCASSRISVTPSAKSSNGSL